MCDTVDSSGCTVRGTTRGLKRSWQNKVPGHGHEVSPLYSCRNLMAMQFATDISTEQLGDEIAKGLGEKNRYLIRSIVIACGSGKALSLFEKTRQVKRNRGMIVGISTFSRRPALLDCDHIQINNRQRRRTPGGVFISLFKSDSDIPEDVKKKILVESNNETQKIMRARKKNQYLLENKTKRPKIMSTPKKGHIDPPENETKLGELLKKEREEDSAFDSVKPLPPIEHLFQQHLVLDADKPVLVGGNIEDIQMET
ncbi:hypothetical protein Angca_007928 [Angiostrongylus cantonensis]|nr:hypothetical protein Angca_007928 [Angiostrongylus cantonensis]